MEHMSFEDEDFVIRVRPSLNGDDCAYAKNCTDGRDFLRGTSHVLTVVSVSHRNDLRGHYLR